MIISSYLFKCDRCGKVLSEEPIVLFPEILDRENPDLIIDPTEEIESLREGQIGRCYCKGCVKAGLAYINTPVKRGRPKKEDEA